MTAASTPRRIGTLGIIALCFVTSGLVRLAVAAPTLAEEFAALDPTPAEPLPMAPESCVPVGDADELMRAIAARARQLDERDSYVTTREATLAIAETRIAEQMSALVAAEDRLAATLVRADTAADEDVARLTEVYERMKPDAAAAIFETMDVNFAAGFLAQMRPESAALVLSNMSAELAYSVSVIIAGRNAAAPRN